MIKELLNFKSVENDDVMYLDIDNFMDFVYQNNLYEYTDDIYDNNDLEELVRNTLERSGWERVKYMLDDIHNTNENYYFKDGYENFRNITSKDINSIIDNMVKELNKTKEDYEL